jgi:hypothetical protein
LVGWLVAATAATTPKQEKHALFANSAKAGNLHNFCSLGNVCQKKNNYPISFHSTRVLLTVLGPFVIWIKFSGASSLYLSFSIPINQKKEKLRTICCKYLKSSILYIFYYNIFYTLK